LEDKKRKISGGYAGEANRAGLSELKTGVLIFAVLRF
jgi:hypothetical protein